MKRKFALWAAITLAAVLIVLTASHFGRLLSLSEVVEVRGRILPIGWKSYILTDLDGDGNDEIVVETGVEGWTSFLKEERRVSIAVMMRNEKFFTFPIPSSPFSSLKVDSPKGRRLVGLTEKGNLTVAELMPNGEWSVQVLWTKGRSTPQYFYFDIGDLDGNGQDDDVIVMLGSNSERILWFKRRDDGRWVKGGEIVLPTDKGQIYFGPWIKPHCVLVDFLVPPTGASIPSTSRPLLLLFLDGRWEVRKFGGVMEFFEFDWDGDGQKERVLVWFLNEKVRWQIRFTGSKRKLDGEWNFKGWNVKDVKATEKLGDGKLHLLIAMLNEKTLTARIIDGTSQPHNGVEVDGTVTMENQESANSKASSDGIVPWRC